VVEVDQFVGEVLPDDPLVLLQIVEEYRTDGSYSETLIEQVLQRIRTGLNEFHLPAAQRQRVLAQVEEITGREVEAATHLGRAIEIDPHQITWRYDYAVLLEKLGRFDEALEQIRWCLRQAPRNNNYRSLLNRIYTAQSDS